MKFDSREFFFGLASVVLLGISWFILEDASIIDRAMGIGAAVVGGSTIGRHGIPMKSSS